MLQWHICHPQFCKSQISTNSSSLSCESKVWWEQLMSRLVRILNCPCHHKQLCRFGQKSVELKTTQTLWNWLGGLEHHAYIVKPSACQLCCWFNIYNTPGVKDNDELCYVYYSKPDFWWAKHYCRPHILLSTADI